MINKQPQLNRGFTLVETLVAVTLLVVAIAGPLTIASRAATAARVAKDQIIAYYLAQDAIEYVRFTRDSSCLTAPTNAACPNATWLSGLIPCTSGTCTIETAGNPLIQACTPSVSSPSCDELYISSLASKFYTHVSTDNTKTIFKRRVTITNPVIIGGRNDEAVVTVTVLWKNVLSPNVERSVILTEEIFNWQ